MCLADQALEPCIRVELQGKRVRIKEDNAHRVFPVCAPVTQRLHPSRTNWMCLWTWPYAASWFNHEIVSGSSAVRK